MLKRVKIKPVAFIPMPKAEALRQLLIIKDDAVICGECGGERTMNDEDHKYRCPVRETEDEL